MTLPKRLLTLALPAILASGGCAGAARARQRAFVQAGYEVQKRADPPSHQALRTELELLIERDIQRVRLRAGVQGDKDLDLYRKIWIIGSGVAVLGGTSGTVASNDELRFGLSGLGVAAAVGGYVLWEVRRREVIDCIAFLDEAESDLRTWSRLLRGSAEPVSRELWEEYLTKATAIRSHTSCLRVRE